ncbi:MAG: DsbA family oxidoreductase [Bacteroidota bacterium]|nr:DsbA family oxidoreductase [Bacteroidota bacterium]
MEKMMRVDIWSDVRCPFCYIGKRKFEAALDKFTHKDQVEISWHSFELDPDLKTQTDLNVYDYFVERKGVPREHAEKLHSQVTRTAADVGLKFNFDQAVIANSFNAHRLIQFAKTKGFGDKAEEALFRAYFTDGQNIDDNETLVQIGDSLGLESEKVNEMLSSGKYRQEVEQDELQAREIGINGVPFFIFNNQYAVSGAQPAEIFSGVLDKSFNEFEKENTSLTVTTGETCSTDVNCS